MAEFTSEINRPASRTKLFIAGAVAAIALAAVFLVVRYQQENPIPKQESGPIVIPGMVRPGNPDFEAYRNKVRIEGVRASIGINFAGNRFAEIDGIIANEGSRKLEAVEMRIILYDVYGQVCKERMVTPLRPGIGLKKGPMEPLEKRTFKTGIESVEQLWNPKKVEIEITGLKYH